MIYWFLKFTLPLFIRVFYRRIHLSGIENIPKNKPVFIAANHSNSFLDGVMISLLLRRKVYVLVRGDVFKKKWANFMLREMNLLPIFRKSDGDMRENIRRNNELTDHCFRIFKRNGTVLIFSEAIARCEKRLRPIKKGTARMAFEMEQLAGFQLDLHIVPAGINYTYFRGFRKELMIHFGAPIPLLNWKEPYEISPAQAITDLTDQLAVDIAAQVVEIKDPEHDHLVDAALSMQRSVHAFPFLNFFNKSERRWASEKTLADKLNESLKDEEAGLKQMLIQYVSMLRENGVDERSFVALKTSPLRLLWALLFTLPALAGYIVFGWIYVFSWRKAVAMVKRDEFFDSVLFGISFLLSFLQSFLLLLVLAIVFGWTGLAIWAGLILCGFAFLAWKGIIRTWLLRRKWLRFMKENKTGASDLLALRSDLLKQLELNVYR